MYYVITEKDGTTVKEKGKTTGASYMAAKIFATKLLKKMGYSPANSRCFENGKWFRSYSNPYWVLRRKWKRYYINNEDDVLCVFLIPTSYSTNFKAL